MLSKLAYRPRALLLYVVTAVCALLVPATAVALAHGQGHQHHRSRAARLAIVSPRRDRLSGRFTFAATGFGSGAWRVVFTVDNHPVRVLALGRMHALRAGALANRLTLRSALKLPSGRHVLGVKVDYGSLRKAVTRTIFVANPTIPVANQASAAPSGFRPPTPTPGPAAAVFNREAYSYRTTWSTTQEATRYQFMVIPGVEAYLIPLLRAINPNLKFLLYQSILHTNKNDYSYDQTVTGCTAYSADVAGDQSWFLHDSNGLPVLSRNQTAMYLMDVGNPGYQQQCAANAIAQAKRFGFSGVFWDVVNGYLSWSTNAGTVVPEYPTVMSWTNAMTSMLAYIGPTLRAQGLISIGNIAGANGVAGWEQWVNSLDGVEEESWTDGGLGVAQQAPFWSQKLAEFQWAAANNKYELLHSYNGTEAANTFGLAAMMLAANGRASYSTSSTNYISNENWFPEFGQAQSLGAPARSSAVLSNGVYERPYSTGIVLVNPTTHSIPAFSLGGGVYSGTGLNQVRTVTMAPLSGLILQKIG
jgi:hypothetical protein